MSPASGPASKKSTQKPRRSTFSNIFDNETHINLSANPNNKMDDSDASSNLNTYGIIDQRLFARPKNNRRRKKSFTNGNRNDQGYAKYWLENENKQQQIGNNGLFINTEINNNLTNPNSPSPSPTTNKYNSFSFRAKRSMSVSGTSPTQYHLNSNTSKPNGGEDNLDDLFDSEYEFEGSQPSSKKENDSDSSSIDDVCFPIDQSDDESNLEGNAKTWPDLRILQEYYNEEFAELKAIAETNSQQAQNLMYPNQQMNNESYNNGKVGFQSPITSKVDVSNETSPLLAYQRVNETEGLNGRLRAPKILPWETNNVNQLVPNNLISAHNKGYDEPFRFSYFRDDLDTTIHASTISGILQPGQTFGDLFVSSKFSKTKVKKNASSALLNDANQHLAYNGPTRSSTPGLSDSRIESDDGTSQANNNNNNNNVFWLDVLNPTDDEMKVIGKSFGIHPLTIEDITLGETREKVELFNEYYFICFRSFDIVYEKMKIKVHNELNNLEDQDDDNKSPIWRKISKFIDKTLFGNNNNSINNNEELQFRQRLGSTFSRNDAVSLLRKKQNFKNSSKFNELRPLNIYMVVFKEGILTFHFDPTPHPVNVRRRSRLLKDYLIVSTDWIAYALIDDITDAFGPMIELVEVEVAAIEDEIIKMQSLEDDSDSDSEDEIRFIKNSDVGSINTNNSSISSMSSTSTSSTSSTIQWQRKNDMLRRIGEARKKVMSLSRLLGSKADVIKGLSKKCNESFNNISPRSEIGMYLGDIQDHIITMVQSLNHCEKLLARSHSNYLAQINIDMTKVSNDMNDVLGKLTTLGTIVLPLNVCTGLWGMNVIVPGQEHEGLSWFWSITAGMMLFAILMYYIARRIGIA